MNILKSYLEGFKKTSVITRVVTIVYGVTLLLGLILAFTFNSVMTKNFALPAKNACDLLLMDEPSKSFRIPPEKNTVKKK